MSIGLVLKATQFAAEKHRHQRRKDAHASPYINHPIALASLLADAGGIDDAEVLCAALLHDTIEDTETTAEELRAEFGDAITAIVLEVTDDKTLPVAERKRLQVVHAAGSSHKARLVKLADKICNVRDLLESPPPSWSEDRRRAYFRWSVEVVAGLRDAHPGLAAIFDDLVRRAPH